MICMPLWLTSVRYSRVISGEPDVKRIGEQSFYSTQEAARAAGISKATLLCFLAADFYCGAAGVDEGGAAPLIRGMKRKDTMRTTDRSRDCRGLDDRMLSALSETP